MGDNKKDEYDVNADLANDHEFEMRRNASEMEAEQKNFNNEEPPDCLKCQHEGMCYPGCVDLIGLDVRNLGQPTNRIIKALRIAMDYGTEDGAQHKAYAIDQMVRALLGDQYDKFIKLAANWDAGN